MTKLISWNVNGFRANLNKGFEEHFKTLDADMFCIQETKMQPEQVTTKFAGYEQYFNSAVKKGYSGTALFTKQIPQKVTFNYGTHTDEGRTIIAEYEKFRLINIYVPNAQRELTRLGYRMQWEDDFRNFLIKFDKDKPLIICGDMNVAHQEIDLKHPKANIGNAGFTNEERGKFSELLKAGFDDLQTIWEMQVEAFSQLYEKYHDTETSPATEKIDKIIWRFNQPETTYYFIMADGEKVGVIRVIDCKDGVTRKRISPIFIMPEHRGKGYAQQAIMEAERLHGASHWQLDTILQERGNCYLYEKLGYHQTGKTEVINDRMTIVFYEKD